MANSRPLVLLVVGSPEPSSPKLVARLARTADRVVAVDRGADMLMAAGVVPDAFVGDADTVTSEALAWVREVSPDRELFPTHKDYTDLSLALRLVEDWGRECGAIPRVLLTCASGGKPDHALAVFGVLAEYARLSPIVVEDGFVCHVLSPDGDPIWRPGPEAVGGTLSLVAIGEGTVASERGMRWGLDHRRMPPLADLGVSNVVESPCAAVECHAGVLAVFLR